MLGNGHPSSNVPPAPREWRLGRAVFHGFATARHNLPGIDPLEPAREALIESFHRRALAAPIGLGQEGTPGQLLAFQPQEVNPPAARLRTRELRWRRAHEQELRELAGQWVVLEGEQLIGHGHDPRILVAEAKARGIQVPYLFFVEPSGPNTVKFGL